LVDIGTIVRYSSEVLMYQWFGGSSFATVSPSRTFSALLANRCQLRWTGDC